MPKFRKKPVVIEAHQWHKPGDHPDGKVEPFIKNPETKTNISCDHCSRKMHEHGYIETLEGEFIVCPGDWIIKGVGEYYPCKPDIFQQTYEPVPDNS